MRQPGGRGLIGRIQSIIRDRPVVAIAVSVLSLLVIASAITFTTPLRCGPARALGLNGIASGCITVAVVAQRPSAGAVAAKKDWFSHTLRRGAARSNAGSRQRSVDQIYLCGKVQSHTTLALAVVKGSTPEFMKD